MYHGLACQKRGFWVKWASGTNAKVLCGLRKSLGILVPWISNTIRISLFQSALQPDVYYGLHQLRSADWCSREYLWLQASDRALGPHISILNSRQEILRNKYTINKNQENKRLMMTFNMQTKQERPAEMY